MAASAVKLFTLLGDHPGTAALKTGAVASDLVSFDFADVKVPNTAFKALIREAKFDLSELAIVAFLQAKAAGKPYALLPATVMGRGQLHTLFMNENRPLKPEQLNGKRIGVRSYTTTTGVWVRGILNDLYGVDSNSITFVTFEAPHVAEYSDPPNIVRAAEGQSLEAMLTAGEVDAAILGNTNQKPPLVPLFADAAAIDRQWAASNGGVPVNHMMVIRSQIAKERPDVVHEVYRLLLASRNAAVKEPVGEGALRFGIEQNRGSLERIIDFSLQQKLISRHISVDALFDETRAAIEG